MKKLIGMIAALCLAGTAWAQTTGVTLGTLNADPDAEVEVRAETLTVDRDSGAATFRGGVVIGQGSMRIAAGEVVVIYDEDRGKISALKAAGGVTFVTDTEAVESASADYDLSSGKLVLSGNVLLTQGATSISSDEMRINLRDGTAELSGNVRSILGSAQ